MAQSSRPGPNQDAEDLGVTYVLDKDVGPFGR